MTTPINTSAIDAAFTAAITAAQSLGDSVAHIASVPVTGETGQTVQTDVLNYKGAKGFRVTASIQIGGYRAIRIHETLPAVRETEWPADIAGEAAQWVIESIACAERFVETQGYAPARLVSCLNMFLTASAAYPTDLATERPKLVAVYSWSQTVQAAAVAGGRIFPSVPHPFSEVLAEAHPPS